MASFVIRIFAIAELEGMVDTVVEEVIDRFVDAGGGDVMTSVARRVPIRVMSEWLGLDLKPTNPSSRWRRSSSPGSTPRCT
jgi:cytochrome P450